MGSSIKTTSYEIMDYWSRIKSPYGNIWVIDPGEIVCMACGEMFGDDYPHWEKQQEAKSRAKPSLEKFWNSQSGLQRCHIIADAAGGADSPENLMLFCVYCHDAMPKLNDREVVLKWASKQYMQRIKDIHDAKVEAFDMFNMTEEDQRNVMFLYSTADMPLTELISKYSNATAHVAQMSGTPGGYTQKSMFFEIIAKIWLWFRDNRDLGLAYIKFERGTNEITSIT